jgi:hypothetical protein
MPCSTGVGTPVLHPLHERLVALPMVAGARVRCAGTSAVFPVTGLLCSRKNCIAGTEFDPSPLFSYRSCSFSSSRVEEENTRSRSSGNTR